MVLEVVVVAQGQGQALAELGALAPGVQVLEVPVVVVVVAVVLVLVPGLEARALEVLVALVVVPELVLEGQEAAPVQAQVEAAPEGPEGLALEVQGQALALVGPGQVEVELAAPGQGERAPEEQVPVLGALGEAAVVPHSCPLQEPDLYQPAPVLRTVRIRMEARTATPWARSTASPAT